MDLDNLAFLIAGLALGYWIGFLKALVRAGNARMGDRHIDLRP